MRFRLSAVLLWSVTLLIPVALGMLVYGLLIHHENFPLLGIGLVFFAIVLRGIQWILSLRAKCPLCMVPSLSHCGCSKNRNARKLFGSYRLRVATTILFRNYFRCPYCGEPSVMEVRRLKRI